MAFTIVNDSTKSNRRYKMTQRAIEFMLNPLDRKVSDPEIWLKNGFRRIYDHLVVNISTDDKVGITFTADEMDTDFHIHFRFMVDLKFESVWQLLNKLYQSNKGAIEGDTFKIIATSFSPYRGAGRVHEQFVTFEEECNKRRGIITIKNKDNLCLVRALVVGMAYAMNIPYLMQIRRNIGKRQDEETYKLIEKIGVQIPPEGAGIAELQHVQNFLSDYKITVYAYGSKGRTVLFEGPDAANKINLLHHKNHFNVITNLTGAFCCRFFCETCHTPYNTKDRHRCRGQCPCCRREPPCEKVKDEVHCSDCNRKFRGKSCFDNHKASTGNGKSMCDCVKRCSDCLKTVKSDRKHVCGEIFCKICKKHQPSGHQCYIQVDTGKPRLDDCLFVFYDLETRQDTLNARQENLHTPVLCVFQQRCRVCFDLPNDVLTCAKCGLRRQVVNCDDVIQPFMQHLFALSKKFKSGVTVIAHNGQAYDHQFILRHIVEKTDMKPDVIMRGTKILMMSVGKLKFIDSLNYFPMKLADLPKAFGLSELKKGYFPHLFNTLANKNYVGSLPDARYYTPDTMKAKARDAFLKWYEENEGSLFDMQKEMVEYCISDVDILTEACLAFHKLVMQEGNVSPFTEAITIPGACNKLFRRNFLKPGTIGVIPKNGYRNADIQSKIAVMWLIYEEGHREISIQHAAKQREAVVAGVKVDGFVPETKQVFDFHGCYFHGCPTCFSTVNREAPIHEDPTDSLNARYERTLKKTERLRENGYEVVEMWEHEFRAILDKELEIKLSSHPLLAHLPLNPRDAFYGGRTGCTRSFYRVSDQEKIKYVDVCSLYPWVCKYGKFPIGHPKVYVGSDCPSVNNVKGLVKCKILPPTQLYHPVLPTKMNDKLMFVLCRTCGKDMSQEECQHTDEERALMGTWVIDEVQKAVEKGYRIMEVYEVWQYDIIQHNRQTATEGLFTEMMNKFIRMKQQSSGWPGDCSTYEQRMAYIEDFFNKEGVKMESEEILKNPGLRSLAKLMLNSFWGKFGQRENQPRCTFVRQPVEFFKMDNDPSININHVSIINEEVLLVSWEYKDEAADLLTTVNVAMAAYVTAQARLKLYSYLEKLGDRVLYYDTDSIIYISRPGQWDVPIGSSLGEMTNELEEENGPDSYIVEFSSAGPKNYSYIVFSPEHQAYSASCKVKGFCLNHTISQQINPVTMTQMIKKQCDEDELIVESTQIRRTQTLQLVTKTEMKKYKPCLEKRKFNEDYDSTPYGFKKSRKD